MELCGVKTESQCVGNSSLLLMQTNLIWRTCSISIQLDWSQWYLCIMIFKGIESIEAIELNMMHKHRNDYGHQRNTRSLTQSHTHNHTHLLHLKVTWTELNVSVRYFVATRTSIKSNSKPQCLICLNAY